MKRRTFRGQSPLPFAISFLDFNLTAEATICISWLSYAVVSHCRYPIRCIWFYSGSIVDIVFVGAGAP
jgi:hypothetical protein